MRRSIYIWMLAASVIGCSTEQKGEDHSAHSTPQAATPSSDNNGLMLTESQIRLANITTQKVSMQPVGQTQVLNGVLAVDEESSQVISTRIAGRLDRLFFKEPGRTIRQGEPL